MGSGRNVVRAIQLCLLMVRRTAVYVASLPTGCSTVVIEGQTLQQCGTTYYVASGSQYEVVNVE